MKNSSKNNITPGLRRESSGSIISRADAGKEPSGNTISRSGGRKEHSESVISRPLGRRIVGFSEAGLPIFSDELIEPYFNLIRAVVGLAMKDYRDVFRQMLRVRSHKKLVRLQHQKTELEEFFDSDWFETLTGMRGSRILGRLRLEVIEEEKVKLNENA